VFTKYWNFIVFYRLLCKIGDMNIIYDNHNSAVSRTDYLEGMANRVCTNDCAAQNKLVLIGLAAVDLSAGRKYVLIICLM
jgi:hypothetical protein